MAKQTTPTIDYNAFAEKANAYNEEQNKKKTAVKNIDNYMSQNGLAGGGLIPNMPVQRQSTPASVAIETDPNRKVKIEGTIGGNNYYYPNGQLTTQGQQNALNGTGHVAGIPQGPNILGQLDLGTQNAPISTPAPVQEQPTATQPKTGGTPKTSNTAQTPQEPQPAEDIINWEIPESWEKQEGTPVEDNSGNEQALSNMEADLMQSTEGQLYGKVTADENGGNGIHTSADPYNVQTATNQARIANLKKLQGMNSEDIATSLSSGFSPYGEQAMADLQQYNPAKYEEVQKYLKQQQGQDAINSITMGKGTGLTSTEASVSSVNTGVDSWADSISTSPQQAGQLVTNISNTMANNGTATTATQEMLNINGQLADLQYKLDNVYSEAKASFKGDVPDYIVKARASSLTQQYQAQIEKLQSRYNAAMDLYKTELSNAQWKEEMNLKYLQYQQGVSESNWKQYYQSMQLKQDSVKRVNGKAYQMNYDGTMTQISDTTAYTTYQKNTSQLLQGYIAQYTNGGATKTANGYKYNISGGQCETFTDNFTEAATGLRMTGANGRGRTTAEEKLGYINSFTPEVGSVAIAVGGAYDSTYGHTMLVTGYDETTGMVSLLWSNNGGDEMVYSSTVSLKDLANSGVKGFRNPYYDMAAQNSAEGQYAYYAFNTPMASAFERISSDSSLSGTQRSALPIAMEMYNTLYEIANNGQLDALVENGDLALILNDMKNKKFSSADKGEKFLSSYTKALTNKANELAGGEASYAALMALQRVVEAKLRDESGAAISSSEWLSNFSYLLPQAGESEGIKQEKLKAWDRIISTKFITAGGKMSEYQPIFSSSTVREIR